VFKIVLLSWIFSFALTSVGQIKETITLNIQNFKIQQGLPNNNINFCFQDKIGFIWIGTYSGLSKYDGFQFKNFYPNPNKKDYFKIGQFISHLKVSDSVYFLTTKLDGIYKLNVETDKIVKILNSPASPTRIFKDKLGDFWVGTLAGGFYRYILKTDSFQHFTLAPLLSVFSKDWNSNTINQIEEDPKNDSLLWLGARNGLYVFNKYTEKIKSFKIKDENVMKQFAYNHIVTIKFDNDGNLWVGKFFGGLAKFNTNSKTWQNYFFDPAAFNQKVLFTNIITSINFEDAHTFYLTTNEGAMLFDLKTNSFSKYELKLNDKIMESGVSNIFIDNNGNQWFSHLNQKGLSMASKRLNSVKKIAFPPQKFKPDYYGSVVSDMCFSQKHQIYLITNTNNIGLLIYDKNFELLHQISVPSLWQDKEPFVLSIKEDDNGLFWLSDITNSLFTFDYSKLILAKIEAPLFKYCYQIERNKDGSLFFLTEKGVFKFQNKQWQIVFNKKVELFSNFSENGFYYLEKSNILFYNSKLNTHSFVYKLPSFATDNYNYIQNIFKDSKNRLWIPLEFGGVYLYDLKLKKNTILSTGNGINSNYAREVKEDKNGLIFLLCNGGFYFYNELQGRFVDFDNLSHRVTNDWYEHCLFFTQNNDVLVSRENDFYIINSANVLSKHDIAPVITRFYGQYYEFNNNFKNVEIPNYQTDVNVFISNFDFSGSNETIFEYQLNDFGWKKLLKGSNQLFFSNLNATNYVLKIRVLGSHKTNVYYFKINQIWYQSKVFYILLIIGFLSLMLILAFYFNSKKSKEKELQKRIAELKLVALQSQLNPHFLFNCLTSISGLIKTKAYDRAEKILIDFAQLMRSILLNSNKDFISLEEELKISQLYLDIEKVRKNNAFDYEINVAKNIDPKMLVPPLILQPFLENCIKHGFVQKTLDDKGLIEVKISKENHRQLIEIKDNGIGLVENKNPLNSHQSMGIEIQKERLQQYEQTHNLKYKITTKFVKNEGSIITIEQQV